MRLLKTTKRRRKKNSRLLRSLMAKPRQPSKIIKTKAKAKRRKERRTDELLAYSIAL